MYRGLLRRWLPWVLLLAAGCERGAKDSSPPYPAPPMSSTGEVIAQVGPVKITSDELAARFNAQSPFVRERFRSQDKRKEFVEQEIQFEVLAQEAWKRKLYEHPEVLKELKKRMVQLLLKEELDKRLGTGSVSEDELKVEYAKSKDEFIKPERARLSQIVLYVDNDNARAKARKKLEALKTEILKKEKENHPNAFADAARQVSEDTASKANGGDLDFLTRTELNARYGDAVGAAVFEGAKVGDMMIADAPNAVLLFRKTGQRRALDRTLEMVKPQLQSRLMRQKRTKALQDFVAELEKKMGVKINEEALSKVDIQFASDKQAPPPEKVEPH